MTSSYNDKSNIPFSATDIPTVSDSKPKIKFTIADSEEPHVYATDQVISRDDITVEINNSPKKKVGRPPVHGLSGSITYISFIEATRRCGDPTHPQYADYGGRGIKCLLTLLELVADIGLRPPGTTLDRINNDGNYEVGNVRWATRKQQANNRRPPRQRPPHFYQARAMQIKAVQDEGERAMFRDAARAWLATIDSFNRVSVSQADREFLVQYRDKWGVPRANFGLSHPFDAALGHVGIFALPALNSPGDSVVLNGGPFAHVGRNLNRHKGILVGMSNAHPSLNCSDAERWVINDFFAAASKGQQTGLCFTGKSLIPGETPIEGRLLAVGSYLARKRDVTFLPSAALIEKLEDRDSDFGDVLIVPDLKIRGMMRAALRRELRHRMDSHLLTILYVDDLWSIGEDLAVFITDNYHVVPLDDVRGKPALKFPEGPAIEAPPPKPDD